MCFQLQCKSYVLQSSIFIFTRKVHLNKIQCVSDSAWRSMLARKTRLTSGMHSFTSCCQLLQTKSISLRLAGNEIMLYNIPLTNLLIFQNPFIFISQLELSESTHKEVWPIIHRNLIFWPLDTYVERIA
jgi:hypothetical protein